MADGKPQGTPKLVKTQMGNFRRLRMTKQGAYFFSRTSGDRRNVFAASFDPTTGDVTQHPIAVSPSAGLDRTAPAWISNTGEIVYLEGGTEGKLMIHSPESGTTSELVTTPKITGFNFNSLSACPPGKWLALHGRLDDGQGTGLLIIDCDSGQVTRARHATENRIFWSRDGRYVYYVGSISNDDPQAKLRRDMQSGRVAEVSNVPPFYDHYAAISPGGQDVAYADEDSGTIKVAPIAGGEERVVVSAKGVGSDMFWSPDGRFIGYLQNGQLWRVASGGGEPELIEFKMPSDVKHVRLHADGKQVLFSAHRYPNQAEVWALEDFLPDE